MERISSSGSSRTVMKRVNIQSKEVMQEVVLRLVWGAGVDRCFTPRPYTSLVRNIEGFLG